MDTADPFYEVCDEVINDGVGCTNDCLAIDILYECLIVGTQCTLKCGNNEWNNNPLEKEDCDYNELSADYTDRSNIMYITDRDQACCQKCKWDTIRNFKGLVPFHVMVKETWV